MVLTSDVRQDNLSFLAIADPCNPNPCYDDDECWVTFPACTPTSSNSYTCDYTPEPEGYNCYGGNCDGQGNCVSPYSSPSWNQAPTKGRA